MTYFPEIVFQRSCSAPASLAYRFYQGSRQEVESLSFYALWEQAASLAYKLQSAGLTGQPVLLICKSQRHFVVAFFACLLSGCIAVPTAPPRRQSLLGRFQLLTRDSQTRAIIADYEEGLSLDLMADGHPVSTFDMRSLQGESSASLALLAARWSPPAITSDTIAFLQYTSGSTGDPKGVVVTHGNLVANCASIQQAMALSAESVILTALPLFHDMGLIGGVLESMYVGCLANCMSPVEFVQHPERWLHIMSSERITVSGGPNFMYELAARTIKPEQLQGCDLSAWRVAFCGAEPIRSSTIETFTQKFQDFGFRRQAFYPCYGMAESTLFITGKIVDSDPVTCRLHDADVVGCGVPGLDTRVEIVDPDSCARVTDGSIGEIWVAGSSVAQGYWMRPELTAHSFTARVHGDDDDDGVRYLRTGDLGYVSRGELFVTGRLKDLIIAYGKKYAPHDLEDEAERSHPALCQSGGAAFSVTQQDADRVVLVFELRRDWLRRHLEWDGILSAIRASVSANHGVALDEIVMIKPGSLPRTSSGKVRRAQCRSLYLAGTLERVAFPSAS